MTDDFDMDIVGNEVYPMPALIYGRPTQAGTVQVRERFEELGISFVEVNIDEDETAARYVEEINDGSGKLPTIVFGDEEIILVEPDREALDAALRQAGYQF